MYTALALGIVILEIFSTTLHCSQNGTNRKIHQIELHNEWIPNGLNASDREIY